jgi:tetratricopeptide (TPR) repeat protein
MVKNYFKLSVAAFICLSSFILSANEAVETLLDKQHNTAVIERIEAIEPKLQTSSDLSYLVEAYSRLPKRLEDGENIAEKALQTFPDSAPLLVAAANLKFKLASNASIFSAPGLAKEGLRYLEHAHQVEPKNEEALAFLIGFYGSAPGIVGGDKDAAIKLAKEWSEFNPKRGGFALLQVLDEESTEANALKEQLAKAYPGDYRFDIAKAKQFEDAEQYAEAVKHYYSAVQKITEADDKLHLQYTIGRLAAVHNVESQLGVESLSSFIAYYEQSEMERLPWAKARLAKIYVNSKNKPAAQQVLEPLFAAKWDDSKLNKELKSLNKDIKKMAL